MNLYGSLPRHVQLELTKSHLPHPRGYIPVCHGQTNGWGWICSHLPFFWGSQHPSGLNSSSSSSNSKLNTPHSQSPTRQGLGRQGPGCTYKVSLSLSLQTPKHRAPGGVTKKAMAKALPSSSCLNYQGFWRSWGLPPTPYQVHVGHSQTSLTGQRFKCPDYVPSHSSNLPSSPPDRMLGSWRRNKMRGQGCWGKPWAS